MKAIVLLGLTLGISVYAYGSNMDFTVTLDGKPATGIKGLNFTAGGGKKPRLHLSLDPKGARLLHDWGMQAGKAAKATIKVLSKEPVSGAADRKDTYIGCVPVNLAATRATEELDIECDKLTSK